MIQQRVLNLQKKINNGQAVIITSESNRFYFTGFHSSAGTVVITKNNAFFIIDFRYYEKAKDTVSCCKVLLADTLYASINEILKSENVKKIYIETDTVNLDQFKTYKNAFSDAEVTDDSEISDYIKTLRSIKSDSEIANIIKAQEYTDKTFNYILQRIDIGRTEKEIMLDMEFFMRGLGSEGVSFDFIVVSGKNSSLPHGTPTDKQIESGDFITMDFGAVYNGYRSDMTRTVAIRSVTDEMQTVYNTVLKAQKTALCSIKPGVICKETDKIARDIIYNAGYKGCFGHGLGHSVGIEIHESPCFNTRDDTILSSGTVMTVEPGIYIENKFGVRIEDMVLVTDTGYINLTKSKKDLIVI